VVDDHLAHGAEQLLAVAAGAEVVAAEVDAAGAAVDAVETAADQLACSMKTTAGFDCPQQRSEEAAPSWSPAGTSSDAFAVEVEEVAAVAAALRLA